MGGEYWLIASHKFQVYNFHLILMTILYVVGTTNITSFLL